jgi:hypothetical protein
MIKQFVHVIFLLMLTTTLTVAESKKKNVDSDVKVVSGMSIVGNNETPKALIIVPWKSSEIGQETKLKSNLLNDGLIPVDKAIFMRELDFYKLSNSK